MKKSLVVILFLSSSFFLKAQEVNKTLGVGLQASFPTLGVSVKYGITERSVLQATLAPFGAKSGGGSVNMNFYGARYLHRFTGSQEGSVVLSPYVFAGGGVLVSTINMSAYGLGKSSESMLGYSGGAGLEIHMARKIGLSAELGYGRMSYSGLVAVNSLLFGAGLHYYIN
jgi:hypothetical protein